MHGEVVLQIVNATLNTFQVVALAYIAVLAQRGGR